MTLDVSWRIEVKMRLDFRFSECTLSNP
ncbi:MAG: hypothetical protein RL661_50, partial [Pseudomonadota bacterium]|jgi:hypothetical protein